MCTLSMNEINVELEVQICSMLKSYTSVYDMI